MMARIKPYGLTLLLIAVGISLWLQNAKPVADIRELQGVTMGTTYSIKLGDPLSAAELETVQLQINELLQVLDRQQMSTYAPDSELSRFNNSAPGEWIPVSSDLAAVVHLAAEISALTDGAFDVTVGPLVNRWGFGPVSRTMVTPESIAIPSQAELESLLQQVGYQHLSVALEPPALRKDQQLYVDLSGIAKGYAVDKVAEYLDTQQIHSYFVEIGGELRIKGVKPDGLSWVPAMERPVNALPQVHAVFYSHGESIAVAGSGDYRNYFEEDGKRYSHEIDPRSGLPVAHALAAVYVISATAARADALATAFMILGQEESLALAEREGIAAFFISKRPGTEHFDDVYSSNFLHYLREPE